MIISLICCRYGKPVSSVSIHQYESHTLAYDRSKKIPLWVTEVLSKNPETSADRKLSTFQVLVYEAYGFFMVK